MFGREKKYRRVLFPPELLEDTFSIFQENALKNKDSITRTYLRYKIDDDEFVKNASPDRKSRLMGFSHSYFTFRAYTESGRGFDISKNEHSITALIDGAPSQDEYDDIFAILNSNHKKYKVEIDDTLKKITVFIGHGRSRIWRDLKDHLRDLHGINVTAYETGARAGLTIREVLDELSSDASMAFLVHTAEDVDREGQAHARENVIHETGLFQGVLGFKRAIVFLEDGCNEFSNISGLQQIRFSKGNIKETFGDALAVMRREFSSGD